MKLVPDARKSWRWYSIQAGVLNSAIISTWLLVPDDMRAAVPAEWLAVGALVLTVLGSVGRLVKQGGDDV